ncbi:hypothetical protein [Flavobacterium sp. F52]|uniref:hypothetical protein n=1 Tax=Flavobacterium sp. F52 TaxID=1202532 RepID=UPI000272FE48|nr:hypothetical protein [Flavobacterium sp. F52]EJG00676.1 hypothetical protein FF52_13591 [Flavobacterium sp. F52]
MNFIEYHDTIGKALSNLKLTTSYISGNQDFMYQATELGALRRSINLVEEVPYLDKEINNLKKSWLFLSTSETQKINSSQSSEVENLIRNLRIKLETFKEIAETSKLFNDTETISIRIPEINSFENLQKYASDFKKAIEIPIIDESIGGKATILSADEGSIIFYVSLGTIAAVKLVAGICWAAAVIKKKKAEADIFEQHAKTLELKNDSISIFVEAQKTQLKNILDAEATSIANKEYNHNDPETIERLKLSISTVAELIDKGVQILPLSKDEDIQKSFPDYKAPNLIESSIKQIVTNT